MPVVLDDFIEEVNKSTFSKPTITPHYFHKDLTGSGKKSGRLNASVHPGNNNFDYPMNTHITTKTHFTATKDQPDVRYLPTAPIQEKLYTDIARISWETAQKRYTQNPQPNDLDQHPWFYQIDTPKVEELFDVCGDANTPHNLYVHIEPQVIALRKQKDTLDDGSSKIENTTHIYWRIAFIACADDDTITIDTDNGERIVPNVDTLSLIPEIKGHNTQNFGVNSWVTLAFSTDPITAINDLLDDYDYTYLNSGLNSSLKIDDEEFINWAENNYVTADYVIRQATTLGEGHVADDVTHMLDFIVYSTTLVETITGVEHDIDNFYGIASQLRFLETYDVPLDAYTAIYNCIDKHTAFDADIMKVLIRQNLQLGLNSNLQTLSQNKDQLPIALPQGAQSNYVPDPKFSQQQLEAITTNEPMVMVQAGAGTGKTTAIMNRIDYLRSCGHDLSTVWVWSFTNAAADNVTERNPEINSSTIAMAYLATYNYNFPTHRTSTLDTIATSLSIYFGEHVVSDPILCEFRRVVLEAQAQDNPSMTALANFIESHLDETIGILNTIKQTSLEIALIISYLKIDDLVHYGPVPKFLIIDEVQDNSVFEFMYALRFAAHHKASLFIVGDSSQTLYEFRAANPKALNALESSGTFTTYQLTTNYRSAQAILDFANVALNDIEANQFANIQLHANIIDRPTADTFQEAVQMHTVHDINQREFADRLDVTLSQKDVSDFINGKLAQGEKVCVLAPTRRLVKAAQNHLENTHPNLTVGNLTSDRPFATTLFSKFVAQFWDLVTAVHPQNAAFVFHDQVYKKISDLEPSAQNKRLDTLKSIVDDMRVKWWSQMQDSVQGWLNTYMLIEQNPNSTQDQVTQAREVFFERLQDCILTYEIEHNRINQSLKAMKNQRRREENEKANHPLLVSTIHGVKGLEFDNTIVLVPPYDNGMAEDVKRLYYVALTRAKNAEMIIVGAKRTLPRMVSDYENTVLALTERDEKMKQLHQNPHIVAAVDGDMDKLSQLDFHKAHNDAMDASGSYVDYDQFLDALVLTDEDGNTIYGDTDFADEGFDTPLDAYHHGEEAYQSYIHSDDIIARGAYPEVVDTTSQDNTPDNAATQAPVTNRPVSQFLPASQPNINTMPTGHDMGNLDGRDQQPLNATQYGTPQGANPADIVNPHGDNLPQLPDNFWEMMGGAQ